MLSNVAEGRRLLKFMYSEMMKRKGSISSDESPFDLTKRRKVPWPSSEDQKGNIDYSSPKMLMQSLLGDTTVDDFINDYWEKKPLVLKRSDPNFYGNLLTLPIIKEVIKMNELEFQTDVNVTRYVDGEKEFVSENGKISVEDVDRLMNENKATLQFYHPQRYIDDLWNIVEKMETYFGSLVGSTVYITPADSQGLAPHCEDIESFVLQLEGKAEWKIYKAMVELSRDYTQDLLQESIGDPTLEILLEPGDLLYFPRGVIHQCKTDNTGYSTYISMSTYQQNTWGDFMCHAVSKAIENALEDDVSIRSGLPINYLNYLGTGRNMSAYVMYAEDEGSENKISSNLNNSDVIKFKSTVKSHLAKLVDHIDINLAADSMCGEFMGSRLPPYGHIKDEAAPVVDAAPVDAAPVVEEKKIVPTINDKIKIRYPAHIRAVYVDEDEDFDEDEDDDDDTEDEEMEHVDKTESEEQDVEEEKSKSPKICKKTDNADDDDEDAEIIDTDPYIKIVHSLRNERFTHMGFNIYDEVGCVKFNVSFAKAVIELLSSNDFVAVKDLLMDNDDEKVLLATKLARDGLIEVKSE